MVIDYGYQIITSKFKFHWAHRMSDGLMQINKKGVVSSSG